MLDKSNWPHPLRFDWDSRKSGGNGNTWKDVRADAVAQSLAHILIACDEAEKERDHLRRELQEAQEDFERSLIVRAAIMENLNERSSADWRK